MKDDKNKRKFILHRNHHIGETSNNRYYEGKKPVIGISDAKFAIKKNIQTKVSSDSVSKLGSKR